MTPRLVEIAGGLHTPVRQRLMVLLGPQLHDEPGSWSSGNLPYSDTVASSS